MMEEVLDSEGDIFFNNGPVGLVKLASKPSERGALLGLISNMASLMSSRVGG